MNLPKTTLYRVHFRPTLCYVANVENRANLHWFARSIQIPSSLTLKMKRGWISDFFVSILDPRLADGDPYAKLIVKGIGQLVYVPPEPQRHYPRVRICETHARVVVRDELLPKSPGAARDLHANRPAFDRLGPVRIALVESEWIGHCSIGE